MLSGYFFLRGALRRLAVVRALVRRAVDFVLAAMVSGLPLMPREAATEPALH